MLDDFIAAGGEFDLVDRREPPSADMELDAAREEAVYELSLAGQASSEIPDGELRGEFLVQGFVGFAALATGYARNVRRCGRLRSLRANVRSRLAIDRTGAHANVNAVFGGHAVRRGQALP